MVVKKYKGKIYGAHLTKDEQKAMSIEIRKRLEEESELYFDEHTALMLWTLHEVFGFGRDRMKRYLKAVMENRQYYKEDGSDRMIKYQQLMNIYGVNSKELVEEVLRES